MPNPKQPEPQLTLEQMVERVKGYARPNSVNAQKLLDAFDVDEWEGMQDSLDLLEEFTSLERADFPNQQEYLEARTDAWQEFCDSLDDIEAMPPDDDDDNDAEARDPFSSDHELGPKGT